MTPILRELHWLPVLERINYKIAVLTYKSLHQLAPDYLTEMCHLASDNVGLNRNRSATNGELIPASWKTKHYGQRGFNFAAPTVWNSLPLFVRNSQTLFSFRREVKTVLFKRAYL